MNHLVGATLTAKPAVDGTPPLKIDTIFADRVVNGDAARQLPIGPGREQAGASPERTATFHDINRANERPAALARERLYQGFVDLAVYAGPRSMTCSRPGRLGRLPGHHWLSDTPAQGSPPSPPSRFPLPASATGEVIQPTPVTRGQNPSHEIPDRPSLSCRPAPVCRCALGR